MSNVHPQDVLYWDERLSWVSAIFFIGSVGNASLKSVLPIPDSLWGLVSALVGAGILGSYFYYSKEMLRRSYHLFLSVVFLFALLYFLSAFLMISRGESLRSMLTGSALFTFAWWIPTGVYACSVYNKQILYDVWVKASYIMSAFSTIIFFFHIPDKQFDGVAEYNMAYGYFIILPLLIQIHEYQQKRYLWLLLLVLFEIFTIFVYANRGIILSLVFFLVYKFAFESDSMLRKVFSIMFLILFGLLMLSNIQTIATVAVSVLDSFGLESRTLGMLAGGVIDDMSGRDEIWSICFKMIEKRPLIGWGLGGEYTYLTHAFTGSLEADALCSPHNGIVQNFVNFGIIGGLFSSIIVLIPLFFINRIDDRNLKILIVVFCASRVIPNLVSGDGFFTEPKVAMYLFLFYFGNRKINNLQSLEA